MHVNASSKVVCCDVTAFKLTSRSVSQNWTGVLVEAENWNYRNLLLKHRKSRTLNVCLATTAYPQQVGLKSLLHTGLHSLLHSHVDPFSVSSSCYWFTSWLVYSLVSIFICIMHIFCILSCIPGETGVLVNNFTRLFSSKIPRHP